MRDYRNAYRPVGFWTLAGCTNFHRATESMELSEFEEAIEKALNKVPKRFREILTREEIQVLAREKVPSVLRDQYKGRLLFGIFTGVPYNRRSTFNIQMEPTRIELYQDSFKQPSTTGVRWKSRSQKRSFTKSDTILAFRKKSSEAAVFDHPAIHAREFVSERWNSPLSGILGHNGLDRKGKEPGKEISESIMISNYDKKIQSRN